MSSKTDKNTKNFSWLDTFKSIWYFLDEDKRKFTFSFFFLSAVFFYDFLPVYVVGKIIDFFTVYKPGQSLTLFYFYVIFVGCTWVIASFIRLYGKRSLSVYGANARARSRIWGFERLTEFSLEWHNKENTGNKLQRIFTGADAMKNFLGIVRRDLLKMFATVFGVIVVFLFTDWKFITLILVYMFTFLFTEYTLSKKIYLLSNENNKLSQSAGGVYVESASNMLSIKALGGEAGVVGRVFDKETFSRDMSIRKINLANRKHRLFQLINGVTIALFLYIIGLSLISSTITLGMVVALYTYFNRLSGSLWDMGDLHTDLIDMRSDIAQMMPIFRETELVKTGNEHFPKDWQKIEIKNAVMDYGSGQMGLTDFNLELERGKKVGVAGVSGSGKSTLAKIILGLYSLKSGSFKIGTQDYYSIAHKEMLKNITVVLQETELFNLSMRENITMMRPEDSRLLQQALEISQLSSVIDRLPEGLDAKIGEKGYMLSGGERQRLGIARAIYKNSPIIILDEATSSLDSETEGKIMEKLLGEYGKEKTFIIIAHRLGTLRYTDSIAVMERGRVLENGSYDALMADSSSVFHRMNLDQNEKNSD